MDDRSTLPYLAPSRPWQDLDLLPCPSPPMNRRAVLFQSDGLVQRPARRALPFSREGQITEGAASRAAGFFATGRPQLRFTAALILSASAQAS